MHCTFIEHKLAAVAAGSYRDNNAHRLWSGRFRPQKVALDSRAEVERHGGVKHAADGLGGFVDGQHAGSGCSRRVLSMRACVFQALTMRLGSSRGIVSEETRC